MRVFEVWEPIPRHDTGGSPLHATGWRGMAPALQRHSGTNRRSHHWSQMFYFFVRDSEYIRCELRPAPKGRAIDLVISEHDVPERVERFGDLLTATARWEQLQAHFQQDGWTGPLGRE